MQKWFVKCHGSWRQHEFGSSMGGFHGYLFLLHFSRNVVSDQVKVCLMFLCHLSNCKLSFIFLHLACALRFLGAKKIYLSYKLLNKRWTGTITALQYECHRKGSRMHTVGNGRIPLPFMVCQWFSFPITAYFNSCFSWLYIRNLWDVEQKSNAS